QRTLLRILREIQIPDMCIGLEYFVPEDNQDLKDFIAGKISLKALERKTFRNHRLSPFSHYQSILEYARIQRIEVRGINSLHDNLRRRDEFMAKQMTEEPRPCVCLVGNYHL